MKRVLYGLLALSAVVGVFFIPRVLLGVEIVPASAHDIIRALGPDAKGLAISQEVLPDLFTLTASRIDENSRQFIVEQPYLDGRWKGGKVVIEYARDLSYTLVSVYDKDGRRQRIYSVRTNFTEHIARGSENAPQEAWTAPASAPAQRASKTVSLRSPETTSVSGGSSSGANFEWDEAKGAYVQSGAPPASEATQVPDIARVPEQESTPAPAKHHRKRRHHGETIVVASRSTQSSSQGAGSSQAQVPIPTPMQDSGIWLPATPKTKTSSASTGKVKVANTTWVEKRQEKPAEETPRPKHRRKHAETETELAPAETKASDEWVPKSIQAPPAPAAKAPVPEAVPSTEELLASPAETTTGPDTSEGDKWVPKAVPKPEVMEPEAPAAKEPMQVASIPKPAPVDNSVDNLLKMAVQEKSEMPHESDTWVPKKTEASNTEANLNKELARIREQEKQQAAPKPVVKIRHDVNNPEEGVLPVSSFEKFSGPMYGRHREYERRFNPGKRTRAGAPDHDFYVDEVDRKKEVHNVYYYKHEKGKAPKLVAVERHEKVSFLGNYDIEKEDKGKITAYN